MDPFIGEVRAFCFDFTPAPTQYSSWAVCNGQTIPWGQNQALASVIGTVYGGDGVNTLGLPDLTGSAPIGAQSNNPTAPSGEGVLDGASDLTVSASPVGVNDGVAQVAIPNAPAGSGTYNTPFHQHRVVTQFIKTNQPLINRMTGMPSSSTWLSHPLLKPNPSVNLYVATSAYSNTPPGVSGPTLDSSTLSTVGGSGGQAGLHANCQPYLVLNFCIALAGVYPPRP